MRISDWSSDVCSSDLHVLRRKIEFDPRLQDEALRQPLIVIAFEPAEQIALVGEERCAFHFEPIGGQALEADDRIGAGGIGLEVLANAGLYVEIWPDGAAVERLYTGDRTSIRLNFRP